MPERICTTLFTFTSFTLLQGVRSGLRKYYSGKVTEFDKASRWYSILFEDGDAEDFDWKELEEVLLPWHVIISLNTLTQRIVRKSKKHVHKSGKKYDDLNNTNMQGFYLLHITDTSFTCKDFTFA